MGWRVRERGMGMESLGITSWLSSMSTYLMEPTAVRPCPGLEFKVGGRSLDGDLINFTHIELRESSNLWWGYIFLMYFSRHCQWCESFQFHWSGTNLLRVWWLKVAPFTESFLSNSWASKSGKLKVPFKRFFLIQIHIWNRLNLY